VAANFFGANRWITEGDFLSGEAMSENYRLVYFNCRGRAEPARYLFAYANVLYEDVRFEEKDWPTLKQKMPFGKTPVLEINNGKYVIAESIPITKFLAVEFGLAGMDKFEVAKCDMIVSALRDFETSRWTFFREQDPIKKEELKKTFLNDTAPEFLGQMMKQLDDDRYFVGNSLTWTDFCVAHAFTYVKEDCPTIFDNYKPLNEHMNRIFNIPLIKKWIERRPKTII